MSLRICRRLKHWHAKGLSTNRALACTLTYFHRQPESALTSCTKCAGNGIHTINRTVRSKYSNSPVLGQSAMGVGTKNFSPLLKASSNTCSAPSPCLHGPQASQCGCFSQLVLRCYSTVPSSSLFSRGSEDTPQSPVQINLDLETRLTGQNADRLRQNLTARDLDLDLDQLVSWQKKIRVVCECQAGVLNCSTCTLIPLCCAVLAFMRKPCSMF